MKKKRRGIAKKEVYIACLIFGFLLTAYFLPFATTNTIAVNIPTSDRRVHVTLERPQTLFEFVMFRFLVGVGVCLIVIPFVDKILLKKVSGNE